MVLFKHKRAFVLFLYPRMFDNIRPIGVVGERLRP